MSCWPAVNEQARVYLILDRLPHSGSCICPGTQEPRRLIFDEVGTIRKELVSEYCGQAPDVVAKGAEALDEKLKDLGWAGN